MATKNALKTLKQVFSNNKFGIIIYSVLTLLGISFLSLNSKSESHLFLNQIYNSFFDLFFKYITYLGDGIFVLIISAFVGLFYCLRHSLIALCSYLSSGIIVQMMKHFIFKDSHRPIKYFENIQELRIVEGFEPHSFHSFPSGHSASAFGFFVLLMLWSQSNLVKFIWLSLAFLTAYSRVYLSEHFLIDIIAGSFIGTFCAIFFHIYGQGWNKKWLDFSVRNKQ